MQGYCEMFGLWPSTLRDDLENVRCCGRSSGRGRRSYEESAKVEIGGNVVSASNHVSKGKVVKPHAGSSTGRGWVGGWVWGFE